MLNIVIPLAGLGSRFAQAGYNVPKPLIPVHGVPMIRLVIDNVRPAQPHRFIFVCQAAHLEAYNLARNLRRWAPDCVVVPLDGLTQGAACSVLAARALIDDDMPLMIANSDQYVDTNIGSHVSQLAAGRLDGLIMTMQSGDPKWSFARVGEDGLVVDVAEKRPISTHATVGIYNFRCGGDFVAAADDMIARDLRVGGEFYVAPVYNRMIAAGARIGVHDIGPAGQRMHGLGTPGDLAAFLAKRISQRATFRLETAAA